ncbi:hypothetical protein CDD82_7446 [Ophiocordyceps australis]|uniref:Uncharacterized protein n=1 Tax=Ophiocordyceps australis TaxID=1399860 RepID=A0A2C5Y239_9HYPO|nr:hypothetical protein CDD82_7446 [Ophiocordyceps australis]
MLLPQRWKLGAAALLSLLLFSRNANTAPAVPWTGPAAHQFSTPSRTPGMLPSPGAGAGPGAGPGPSTGAVSRWRQVADSVYNGRGRPMAQPQAPGQVSVTNNPTPQRPPRLNMIQPLPMLDNPLSRIGERPLPARGGGDAPAPLPPRIETPVAGSSSLASSSLAASSMGPSSLGSSSTGPPRINWHAFNSPSTGSTKPRLAGTSSTHWDEAFNLPSTGAGAAKPPPRLRAHGSRPASSSPNRHEESNAHSTSAEYTTPLIRGAQASGSGSSSSPNAGFRSRFESMTSNTVDRLRSAGLVTSDALRLAAKTVMSPAAKALYLAHRKVTGYESD